MRDNKPSVRVFVEEKKINFFGQPIYGQLIKSLDREKIVESAENTAERSI